MVQNDCGCIPVCDDQKHPVGVITDRDITCRVIAEGKDPGQLQAKDCNRIRRVVVVESGGTCCGMVAQADVARRSSEHQTAEVVREVSQPA